MEIAKYDARISPSLDREERQFVEAKFGHNPKEIKESEFKNFLLVLIGKAHVSCNQKPDEANIQLALPDLIDTISKYFSTLTLKEIELAFKLGLLGELGEYYGLNNKTYFGWFKNLIGSQKRIEANRKQGAYINLQNQPKALTDEEKRAIMINACFEAFEIVRKKEYFNDLGNAVYNFIDRNWKMPFSAEQKKKYIQVAKNKIISEKSAKYGASDGINAKKIKDEISAIREGLNENEVISEAKKLIVNQYFTDLIKNKIELKTIIK